MTEPFRKMHLDEEGKKLDTFTVWINSEDRKMLDDAKKILHQSKDSTAFKTLAWIGAKTIGDKKIAYILEQVTSNKRKNKRLNVVDFD
jgi:hypothetical protein